MHCGYIASSKVFYDEFYDFIVDDRVSIYEEDNVAARHLGSQITGYSRLTPTYYLTSIRLCYRNGRVYRSVVCDNDLCEITDSCQALQQPW